jgi:co-chaperonin GroES (HSP10)
MTESYDLPESFDEPEFEIAKAKPRALDGIPIHPKGARIIVIRNEFQQMGRIIIPDSAQQAPSTGKVVAIGDGVPEGFVRLEEQVVFSQYSGIPLRIGETFDDAVDFLSLSMDEVCGELLVGVDKLYTGRKK